MVEIAKIFVCSIAAVLLLVDVASGNVLREREENRKLDDHNLEYVGNDGYPTDKFPLARCEGDCDSAYECQGDLICMERDKYNYQIVVPGCVGTPKSKDTDYCISLADIPPDTYFYVGNDGYPANGFPLQACQGDCDSDDECAGRLKCFQRYSKGKGKGKRYYYYGSYHDYDYYNYQVPGCTGSPDHYGTDYCYDPGPPPTPAPTRPPTPAPTRPPTPAPTRPPTMAPTEACVLEKVGNNGKPKDAYPLGRGEADCDYYSDCETGLLCFERGEYNYHIPVPGCTGDLYKYKYTDYCYDPNDIPAKTLWYVGNDHHPDFVFPLAECHGDCDTNDDCQGTLKCFQRSGKGKGSYYSHQYDQVPGCSGYAEKYVDYCYAP